VPLIGMKKWFARLFAFPGEKRSSIFSVQLLGYACYDGVPARSGTPISESSFFSVNKRKLWSVFQVFNDI
jgi:hypothetical protein